MRTRRYIVHDQIEIRAPMQRVYAIASDPALVPLYAREIARIDVLERRTDRDRLVRSHLRVWMMSVSFVYRYRYRPPTHYSGVQEGGRLLRGYFTFAFQAHGDRTIVSHTEGIASRVPGLAAVAGWVYFRVLGGGVQEELRRLKALVEGSGGLHLGPSHSLRA